MRLEVDAVSAAPRALVWDVLTDWERQPDWMVDARAVEVVSVHRAGVGVTLRCPTDLVGLVVQDVMRVTRWEEGRRLDVVHLGRVIVGTGGFELRDAPGGTTRIVWWEEIAPPLGAVGRWVGRRLVLPLVRRVFQRSLTQLAGRCEQEALRRDAAAPS